MWRDEGGIFIVQSKDVSIEGGTLVKGIRSAGSVKGGKVEAEGIGCVVATNN